MNSAGKYSAAPTRNGKQRNMLDVVEAYYSVKNLRFWLHTTAIVLSILAAVNAILCLGIRSLATGVIWLLIALFLLPSTIAVLRPGNHKGLIPLVIASVLFATYGFILFVLRGIYYVQNHRKYSDCYREHDAEAFAYEVQKTSCHVYRGSYISHLTISISITVLASIHSYLAYDLYLWTTSKKKPQNQGDRSTVNLMKTNPPVIQPVEMDDSINPFV